MKNEGRIMAEGKEGFIMNNADTEKKDGSGQNQQREIVAKNIAPHNTQETKSGGQGDEMRIITKSREEKVIKITPEMDRKLKRLHDFEVEVVVDGKPVKKTAYDVLDMMGSLAKEGLTEEEADKKIEDIKILHDKLEEKYYAESSYGNELRRIFDNEVFRGLDMQRWSDQIVTGLTQGGRIDGGEIAEKMGGDKGKILEIIEKVKKQLPLPEGVEAAPVVAIGEDGQITITPAPNEGGKDDAKPPSQPESTTKNPNDRPGTNIETEAEKREREEKEKKKIDWWKYGSGFLFLFILYMGAQGWYAKMWEQFAERAR